MQEETWVLVENHSDYKIYLKFMSALGPVGTKNLTEAQKFSSERDAMNNPAFVHLVSFFQPEKVEPKHEG